MNILVFSWRDPKNPLAGGAEQVMHEHMKGWIESGHQVTLFSSKFKGAQERESIDGVEIIRHGSDIIGVQFAGFFYYLKNRNRYDFLVDQFHGLPFFTPLYSRKPRLAVIQEIARDVWFINRLPHPFKWIIGAMGYIGEPLLFPFYRKTQFLTGSQSAKKNVHEFGKIPLNNIHIIPHGVLTISSTSFPKKEKEFTLVFLGIHSKDKGIEDAIKCFSLLKNQKIKFWTIGKFETSEYAKHIKKMIKDLDLSKKVKLWGFVSQEKKFKLLAQSHLLINPSIHEGWGLVNIEANSVGVPVVAYNSPGLVDSVKNNVSGIISDKNTPQDLAEIIGRIIADNELYSKLQKGALKWSKNFSWDSSRKKSLSLINQIYRS